MYRQRFPALFVLALAFLGPHAIAARVVELPDLGSQLSPGRQLQDAVNNPANAGVTIVLAPGTYELDPTRPNGGRLVLQEGMNLRGSNTYVDCDLDGAWDPVVECAETTTDTERYTRYGTETMIDGRRITTAQAVGPTAVVRTGRSNIVERVTVKAPLNDKVGGSIDVNVVRADGSIVATIRNNIVEGGQRGVRLQNGAPLQNGTEGSAVVEGNVVRNIRNAPGTPFGFGVQVQNGQTDGNRWRVRIARNRIYASNIGVFVVGNASSNTSTLVASLRNLVEHNLVGYAVAAGFDARTAASGQSNDFDVTLHGDRISDNTGSYFAGFGGGIVAFAALRDGIAAPASNGNFMRLKLLDTTLERNTQAGTPRNLTVIGSRSNVDLLTGDRNRIDLLVRGTQSDGAPGAFVLANSSPDDPNGTNVVNIIGSDVAFERANSGLDLP